MCSAVDFVAANGRAKFSVDFARLWSPRLPLFRTERYILYRYTAEARDYADEGLDGEYGCSD